MADAETTAELTLFWDNKVTQKNAVIASLRNDINTYNQVIEALRSGELPWDRVQIMETGQLKIHQPPQPVPDTCVEEVSREFGKNGKNKAAVAPPCGPQPVEVTVDGN